VSDDQHMTAREYLFSHGGPWGVTTESLAQLLREERARALESGLAEVERLRAVLREARDEIHTDCLDKACLCADCDRVRRIDAALAGLPRE
jgi:hypothetical protein